MHPCGVRAGAAATGCLSPLEIGQSCGSGSAGGGKPWWFLALEQMATAHTRQDLTLAACAATSPYSHSVAIYEPSLCLHLTNVKLLECFQNTSSFPEPALTGVVPPVPRLRPQTRDFSEVPSQSGQGSLGHNLISQERTIVLQPLMSADGDFPQDESWVAESIQECLHWKQESLKMMGKIVHALQPSTMAGRCQHDFGFPGVCDREPIRANQAISSQATEVLICNLSWLL